MWSRTNLAHFALLCGCTRHVLGSVTGAFLPPISPVQVTAAAGDDAVLPCGPTPVNRATIRMLEWMHVERDLVAYAWHALEKLEDERAEEYKNRTTLKANGSLVLHGVTRQDGGTYRCLIDRSLLNVSVILTIAIISKINMTVRRMPSSELFAHCKSSGWSSRPQMSMLDAAGHALSAQPESSVGPDGLFSASSGLEVPSGNVTFICRVEIPEQHLLEEQRLVFDQLESVKTSSNSLIIGALLVIILVLVLVLIYCLSTSKDSQIQRLIYPLKRCFQSLCRLVHPDDEAREDRSSQLLMPGGAFANEDIFKEYGDVLAVHTTGVCEIVARESRAYDNNGQLLVGVNGSRELARRDQSRMRPYRDDIISVGESLHVHPALIAAIISRQSDAGLKLNSRGFGQTDPNCFGIMQINKNYHAVKGSGYDRDHVDQGVTFLIQLIKTMQRTKPHWTKEQQLKGSLACYIAGEDKVIPVENPEDVDAVTPYGDFANDVVARAHWFAENGF